MATKPVIREGPLEVYMLNPYQIPLLIRYFDGIDQNVSQRLLRRVPADERVLTQEFCSLMDRDDQRRERSLAFDADALQTALDEHGDTLDVTFTIAAHQHSPRLEAYVSQADFGFVLHYENTVLPALNWKAAYLMQAKRLFPNSSVEYTANSKFSSTTAAQQQRLNDLAGILGEEAVRYWLYMPPTHGFAASTASALRSLHTLNLARNIFDYSWGLALHEHLRKTGGIDSGMWITDLNAGNTAAAVHKTSFQTSHPFTWFILDHFLQRAPRLEGVTHLNSSSRRSGTSVDRVEAIAIGDPKAAQDLIDELDEKARDRDFDPETMKVLPANSVTIHLRAGPKDGLDVVPQD